MADNLAIKVIISSTREGRFGPNVGKWFFGVASKHVGIDAELVDLRDWVLPYFDESKSPITGEIADEAQEWAKLIDSADGYVIVTPEYNHGYPAVLKNALDHVYYDWARKAVAFVSWGGTGGTRCVEQLRLVTIELDMVPTRWAVHIPNPWFIKDASELRTDPNQQAATALLDHLTWWTQALKNAR